MNAIGIALGGRTAPFLFLRPCNAYHLLRPRLKRFVAGTYTHPRCNESHLGATKIMNPTNTMNPTTRPSAHAAPQWEPTFGRRPVSAGKMGIGLRRTRCLS